MKSASMLNLNEYATAQNCLMQWLKYEIEIFKDTLKIASVRYNMQKASFLRNHMYLHLMLTLRCAVIPKITRNISVTVSIPARKYLDSSLAVHVIGTVRAISADRYYTSFNIERKTFDENLTDEEKAN